MKKWKRQSEKHNKKVEAVFVELEGIIKKLKQLKEDKTELLKECQEYAKKIGFLVDREIENKVVEVIKNEVHN